VKFIFKILFLAAYLGLAPGRALAEENSAAAPDSGEFLASGKNRANVQFERQVFADRLNIQDLAATAAKKTSRLKSPEEAKHLYQVVDPVPLQSYKVYTPWLNHFKETMVFVIGRLDPNAVKIARWSVNLYGTDGRAIKNFTGVGHPPVAFYWNGRDSEQNPVAVGRTIVPEIKLEDFYGAKIMLPQKPFVLDQFLWTSSRQMRAGVQQLSVFQEKQIIFTANGKAIIQEISFLISQQDAVFIEIDCGGPDLELSRERAEVLKKYFAQENLKLRKIQVNNSFKSVESVFYITAIKLYNRGK
jgi:hypothetical protein